MNQLEVHVILTDGAAGEGFTTQQGDLMRHPVRPMKDLVHARFRDRITHDEEFGCAVTHKPKTVAPF